MKTTENITKTIARLPKGYVFTYSDVSSDVNKKEAVVKALNRMVKASKLAKLSKGKFYKPETSPFGNLLPDQSQIVKDLIEEKGKITGYITGYSIYNKLGLTTQVSNTIQIAKKDIRPSFKRDPYVFTFIKQKNTITKENVYLLQLLDVIKYIKKIPDTTEEASCKRLLVLVKALSSKEQQSLVKLSMKYPPSTRALLGAILDEIGSTELSKPLIDSLNPITKYRLRGATKVLSCTSKWNII